MTSFLNMPQSTNPVFIGRRESNLGSTDISSSRSPMLHPALSSSLSRSFGLNSPFSLSALSSSLTAMSSSPGFSGMAMSLGRSFEERPKLEAQFFRNFQCCGLDLQDLHGLLEHFEECHVMFDEDGNAQGGMEDDMDMGGDDSEGTISGPPSPRAGGMSSRGAFEAKKSALSSEFESPDSPATHSAHLDAGMELDMDMDDPEDSATTIAGSPAGSTHSSSGASMITPNATYAGAPMSAFDSPRQMNGTASNKKKFTSAMNPLGSGSMRLGIGGLMGGLDALNSNRSTGFHTPEASVPGSPVMEEAPGAGVDGIFSVPPSASTQAGPSVAVAPSLLFPVADSPEADPVQQALQQQQLHQQMTQQLPPLPKAQASQTQTQQQQQQQQQLQQHQGQAQSVQSQQQQQTQLLTSPVSKTSPPTLTTSPSIAPAVVNPVSSMQTGTLPTEGLDLMLDFHDDDGIEPIEEPDEDEEHDYSHDNTNEANREATLTKTLGVTSLSALPSALNPLGTGVQISPSGRPYTPPSEKPFKCSVIGCDKSYKQQNGLKYHRLHGHCNANAGTDDGKGEGKPYVCHVSTCGKRYKNMNGLRYHYQHSGAHGALGLQMLAQGLHPPPQFPAGHRRSGGGHTGTTPMSRSGTPSRPSSRANSPASGIGGMLNRA